MRCAIVSPRSSPIAAISYCKTFRFDATQIGLSVCAQRMVRSDVASSGVAFSPDTESGFKDVVVINGSFGLGEMAVTEYQKFIRQDVPLQSLYCVHQDRRHRPGSYP